MVTAKSKSFNFLTKPFSAQEIIILEKGNNWVFADIQYTQKSQKPVFMNVDDLHFWRSRQGWQGVFFDIKKGEKSFFVVKKGGEDFSSEKKRGAKSFFRKKKGG